MGTAALQDCHPYSPLDNSFLELADEKPHFIGKQAVTQESVAEATWRSPPPQSACPLWLQGNWLIICCINSAAGRGQTQAHPVKTRHPLNMQLGNDNRDGRGWPATAHPVWELPRKIVVATTSCSRGWVTFAPHLSGLFPVLGFTRSCMKSL